MDRREPIRRRLPGLHAQRPRTHPGDTAEQPAPLASRSRAQHRLKQLTRHAERDLLLKLRAPRAQHPKPARPRDLAYRRQQLALANPGRPLHHHHRPGPTAHPIEQTTHPRQLSLALE